MKRNHDTNEKINLPKVKLNWTDSKAAIIELIYALYYRGTFNNGQADIKEIAKYFMLILKSNKFAHIFSDLFSDPFQFQK
ncbi:hypothetical protein EIH07_05540 [Chryseobacterium taklimakanense]|nr:hypothetical protein EIH07_05540 [Chryseobacterium taklimakanense]